MAPLLNNDRGRERSNGTPLKARRKLTMDEKPLAGKSFYLYLKCSFNKIGLMEKDIQELGGVVESFLSKSVNYVVTDRTSSSKETSTLCSSPGQSPHSDNISTSPSPGSSESPAYTTLTRGKLLLQKAVYRSSAGGTDVLANAKAWGVKIVLLEEFKLWIADAKKPRPRTLREPYIKFEDHGSMFKPSYWQIGKGGWPKVCLIKPRRRYSSRRRGKGEDVTTTTPGIAVRESKPVGYCECCLVRCDDLAAHLQTDTHRAYASQDSNYSKVDLMIEKLPSLEQFQSEFMNKNMALGLNEILLVSPFAKRPRIEGPPRLIGACLTAGEGLTNNAKLKNTEKDVVSEKERTTLPKTSEEDDLQNQDGHSSEGIELGSCVARVMETLERWDDFQDDSDDFGRSAAFNTHEWNGRFVADIDPCFASVLPEMSEDSRTLCHVEQMEDNVFTAEKSVHDNTVEATPQTSEMLKTKAQYETEYHSVQDTYSHSCETTQTGIAGTHKTELRNSSQQNCSRETKIVDNLEEKPQANTSVSPETFPETKHVSLSLTPMYDQMLGTTILPDVASNQCGEVIMDCTRQDHTSNFEVSQISKLGENCSQPVSEIAPSSPPSPIPIECLLPTFIGLTERIKMNKRRCRTLNEKEDEEKNLTQTIHKKRTPKNVKHKKKRKCSSV